MAGARRELAVMLSGGTHAAGKLVGRDPREIACINHPDQVVAGDASLHPFLTDPTERVPWTTMEGIP